LGQGCRQKFREELIMRINHNLMAMNTHRQMGINQGNSSKSMEKLSSGSRINRAADDAAGLSISEKMRGQIRGLQQASRNSQDGISSIQTAEGALNEVSSMLVRMKELVVQAKNGTNNAEDIGQIELELKEIGTEIDNVIDNTKFNGASAFASKSIVVDDQGNAMTISAATTTDTKTATAAAKALPGDGSGTLPTIAEIESGIKEINKTRSTYGAQQNRLESTVRSLDNTSENLQAAESRIRDVDMAKEMMNFTKNNILQQAAQAMLAQANQAPQGVLQLLR
jgi:flagellin